MSATAIALEQRWKMLSDFVQTICAGRDESHGHAHMKTVAEMSSFLIQQDYHDRRQYRHLIQDAITAAWLHDIADHKYDHDGTLEKRLDEFGAANISNYADIKQVIKYVSYSTENKAILAIGNIGITRAVTYTKDVNPTFTDAQVIAEVCKHADEKLLRLATEFIRTDTARALARKEHEEMVKWIHLNHNT